MPALAARALCLALMVVCCAPSARASDSKSILVIEQEELARPAFLEWFSGLKQSLAARLPGRVILYTENLDLGRFHGTRYRNQLEGWFRTKYRGRSLDAIVAIGDRSLDLTLNLREELWPNVPIVFSGVQSSRLAKLSELDNVTGVTLQLDVQGTLEAAIRLCPGTRDIVFVSSAKGYTEIYRGVRQEVQRFCTNGFNFIPMTDLTMAETKQRLASLPPRTIVFYLAVWMDAAGQIFNPRDALAELSAVSSAPVFGVSDTQIGYGLTGGSCLVHSSLGSDVGERLAEVVRAGGATGIPVVESPANRLLFDWRELKRRGLQRSRLPAGAELRFHPPALWEGHRDAVLIVSAALVFQSGLIAALLVQRFHRRRAEKRLKETEERMSLAVQAAGLGMWVWQANAEKQQFGPRCRGICGVGTCNTMGRPESCKSGDEDSCPLLTEAVSKLTPANPTFETECLHREEAGTPCWIASRGRGYFDKEGRLQRLIGVSMDVTEKKNSARALQEQREQLAHVGRVSVMGQLASSLAHELNQPLGAILRNAEAAEMFLQKDPPDLQELGAILSDIRKDDERAGAVIDRMRALLKRRNSQPAQLALPGLIDEVLSFVRADANSHRVQLSAALEAGLPAVHGDRVQLQQVLLNLVLNALDAISGSGKATRNVVVRAARRAGAVEISVADSGSGVPVEHMPRIFEPFFTTKENGMGMGLPISRGIIEVHGGRIWAENLPAGGAVFRFTLPMPPEEPAANGLVAVETLACSASAESSPVGTGRPV